MREDRDPFSSRRRDEGPSHLVRRVREGTRVPRKKEVEERPAKRGKNYLIIAGGVVVVMVVLTGLFLVFVQSPRTGEEAGPTPAAGDVSGGPVEEAGPFRFLPGQDHPEGAWSDYKTLVGDVNGDGRADLIWNITQESNRVYVGLAQADGTLEFLPVQERSEKRWGGFKTLIGDVNGDGRTDLVWNETQETNRVYVGLAQTGGTFEFLPAQDRSEKQWSGFQTLTGDVNGDGRTDLIWNEAKETNRLYVGFAQADGTFEFQPAQDHPETGWDGFQTLIGDFNGDGRTDLVWSGAQETNRLYVGLAQADGTFKFLPAQDLPEKEWGGFQTLVGDVNGDGRTDLIWNLTRETNQVYVGLSQTGGTFAFVPAQDHPKKGWSGFQTLVGDVNGDGRADLIWNETQEVNRLYIGLAQADGTFQFLPAQDHPEKGWGDFQTLTGDVNGDGRTDLVWNALQDMNRLFVGLAK